MLREELLEHVLIDIETNVANPERRRRLLGRITEPVGAGRATLLWRSTVGLLLTTLAEVQTKTASVNLETLHLLDGFDGAVDVGVLNVAKAFAPAGVAIRDDAHASELAECLELARKPFLVAVEADVAAEEIGGGLLLLAVHSDLGSLWGRLSDSLGLALLAGRLLDLGLDLFLLIVVGIIIVVFFVVLVIIVLVNVSKCTKNECRNLD